MLNKFQGGDTPFQLLQTSWATDINPLLSSPLATPLILSNVSLSIGTTVINHKLGKKLTGWNVIGINAAASIYDAQASNQTPQLTLVLISDAPVIVNLLVF